MINIICSYTDYNTSWTGNIGEKLLNFFKFLRGLSNQAEAFFTATITVGSSEINIWHIFGIGGLIAFLTAIIVKKIVPLA